MKDDNINRQNNIRNNQDNHNPNIRVNAAHNTNTVNSNNVRNNPNNIQKPRVANNQQMVNRRNSNTLSRNTSRNTSGSTGGISKINNKNNHGSPKLKTNSSSGKNFVPNALKNRSGNRMLRSITRGISSPFKEEETVDENIQDEVEENTLDDAPVGVATNKNLLVIMRYLPILLPVAGLFLLVLLLVALFAAPTSITSSFSGLETHNSSDPGYAYDESNPEGLAAEKDYNNKLFETISFFESNYHVNLDKYLLHAAISYRYYNDSIDGLYLSDSGVTEDDLETILEEKNLSDFDVEYSDYTRKIGVFAALMVNESNGTYLSNNEKGGIFYNNLIDSDFFTYYYSDLLQNDSITSKQELVDDIFDYYEYAKSLLDDNKHGGLIFDSMKVHLQTCAYDPGYTYKEINGLKVYNNPLTSEGTNYPSYLSMTDYVKGVLMGEIGSSITEENKEGLKVMATAALSYIIRDDNSGFDLRTEELYFPTGNCRQVACDPNNGCTYITGKTGGPYGTAFVGVGRFGSEGGQHQPLSEAKQQILNEVLADVFGNIFVKKGVTSQTFTGSSDMVGIQHYADLTISGCTPGYCFGQTNVLEDARNGMTYNEIIAKYLYNLEYDVINIKEGLYVTESDYATGNYDGNVIFYDQNDYKQKFCGRTDTTIARAGCGVTASAIVISTLTNNRQYDPIYMNDLAKKGMYCGPGISGTNDAFFKEIATKFNFGYQKTDSGTEVINALKTGNSLVIAHMGKGYFTNNGHYIVLSQTRDDGKVYVHDPNNKMNKEGKDSGNGWYDINDIVDQLKASFHIITKS